MQPLPIDPLKPTAPRPEPDGVLLFQYGTWSYQSLEPVSADSGGSTSSGGVNPALIVVGVLAAVALVLGGVLIGRRRTSDDDVE